MVAIGTTVVRALEHAASPSGWVPAGDGVANQRLGPDSELRVTDAILSGTHEAGSSHHALLGAFTSASTLRRADSVLQAAGFTTHEFGESVWLERAASHGACADQRCLNFGARLLTNASMPSF